MSGPDSSDEGVVTGINVTPLADVALVLLIILMVTAQFAPKKQPGPSSRPEKAPAKSDVSIQPVISEAPTVVAEVSDLLPEEANPVSSDTVFSGEMEAPDDEAAVSEIGGSGEGVEGYEPQIVDFAEQSLRNVSPPGREAARLSMETILAGGREAFPGLPPSGVSMRSERTSSAAVSFGREETVLADVMKWEPFSEYNLGRTLRAWVRPLHTGVAGQTLAGVGALGGVMLTWTGLAMAWRRIFQRKPWSAAAPSVTAEPIDHEPAGPKPASFGS